MNPTILKALVHELVQFAIVYEKSPLLTALLTGTEASVDMLIDQFLASPAGQRFLARFQATP